MADLRELLPPPSDWLENPRNPALPMLRAECSAVSVWASGPVVVISSLQNADLPDGAGVGLQWHVSISRQGKRPKDTDVRRALRAFGMVGAEEDNHHPGNARHFWRPVDPQHRVDCQCKESEQTIAESDGYTWTNPREGAGACRGCEWSGVMGKPCPVHAGEAVHGG